MIWFCFFENCTTTVYRHFIYAKFNTMQWKWQKNIRDCGKLILHGARISLSCIRTLASARAIWYQFFAAISVCWVGSNSIPLIISLIFRRFSSRFTRAGFLCRHSQLGCFLKSHFSARNLPISSIKMLSLVKEILSFSWCFSVVLMNYGAVWADSGTNWSEINEICGIAASDRIVGGSRATLGQFPWIAHLGIMRK